MSSGSSSPSRNRPSGRNLAQAAPCFSWRAVASAPCPPRSARLGRDRRQGRGPSARACRAGRRVRRGARCRRPTGRRGDTAARPAAAAAHDRVGFRQVGHQCFQRLADRGHHLLRLRPDSATVTMRSARSGRSRSRVCRRASGRGPPRTGPGRAAASGHTGQEARGAARAYRAGGQLLQQPQAAVALSCVLGVADEHVQGVGPLEQPVHGVEELAAARIPDPSRG